MYHLLHHCFSPCYPYRKRKDVLGNKTLYCMLKHFCAIDNQCKSKRKTCEARNLNNIHNQNHVILNTKTYQCNEYFFQEPCNIWSNYYFII